MSRIVGTVTPVGRSGAVSAPPDLDLLSMVAGSVEQPAGRTATVLVRPGAAAGLRRRSAHAETGIEAVTTAGPDPSGRHADWDVVQVPFAHLWDSARMIAEQGPDVFVIEPSDLRESVIRLLLGAMSSGGRPAGDRWAMTGSPKDEDG